MKSKDQLKTEALKNLSKIDLKELNGFLNEVSRKLYAQGLVDWIDQSWEHPDPEHVDAVYGDIHTKKLDERHGYSSAFLESCVNCGNIDCWRNKKPDTAWRCNKFERKVDLNISKA